MNNEYKEFVVNYMPDCSTEEHLHKKIQEFQCYKNSTITVRPKAFALMHSRYIDFPENFKKIVSLNFLKDIASIFFDSFKVRT